MRVITKVFITILFPLTISSNPLHAQVFSKGIIKGKLTDEKKDTLGYGTVLLKRVMDSSIYKTAICDVTGLFVFDNLAKGNYFIEISAAGFEKIHKGNLKLSDTAETIDLGLIILRPATAMLQGVIINTHKPLIERQIDKTVVNVDQSITSAGSTVLEVMQKLPGVQMTSDGDITLNGKSGVTVFIDGKPTYLSASDLVILLNGMPASSIQNIEIMTNPSAKYDAAGTGGIINIMKKKNRKEGFNGSFNGSVGQQYFWRYNGGVILSYKNKYFNFYLSNSYSYNKNLLNRAVTNDIFNGNNSLLTEQVSNNNNINSGKSYSPSLVMDIYLSKKTTLSVLGNLTVRNTNDQTISTMYIKNSNRTTTNHENFTGVNADKPINYTTGFRIEHKMDSLGKEISFDIDYSRYRNKPMQNNITILNDASNNFISQSSVFLNQQRQLNIYSAKADYTQHVKGFARIDAGIKSSYVKTNNDNTFYNQVGSQYIIDSAQSNYSLNTENINAVYINLNTQHRKITLQAGLRTEQTVSKGRQLITGEIIKQNYLQLFPTIFFDYKINNRDGFNIKLGRRTERAAYNELIPFRRPQTPTLYFQGNPNLRPQISYHGEITYSYHNALFLTFGYDIDHDYIRTIPYLDSNKTTLTRIPTNIQGAHSWNVDIAYSHKLFTWWSTDNTLSIYQNSFTGHTADNFNLNNNGIASIYLSANNSFAMNHTLSAECNFEYNSKRQFVTSTFGAYQILSIGIKQQMFKSKGSISLNANNIFKSESHDAIDRYRSFNQYAYLNFYTRSIRLNFSYRFGKGKISKTNRESGSVDEQNRAGN
jgi:hypothetical protein